MALCESQLDSGLGQMKREQSSLVTVDGDQERNSGQSSPEKRVKEHNGDVYGLGQVAGALPLSVDYRSPVSHFVPSAVEMYAARHKQESVSPPDTGVSIMPMKRKRGRPRVDKTSPEYLANLAARRQAKEMGRCFTSGKFRHRVKSPLAVFRNQSVYLTGRHDRCDCRWSTDGGNGLWTVLRLTSAAVMSRPSSDSGEKRKRGRPRVDKTSPEYLARKRAREMEMLERRAKKDYKRRGASDSGAPSSAGESGSRVKRKYTKRSQSAKKNDSTSQADRVKGKRGRPRKSDQIALNNKPPSQQPKIRVRSNLMPDNTEPIAVDSDEEPNLGSPSQASDSLSFDDNLRALRHIHEKYANIDKDDLYGAHLLAANFKKPSDSGQKGGARDDDEVLSVRSSEGCVSVKELESRVEKLEDSSNSDSDSSSSGSSSSSSGSGTSSSSEGDDSSSSSDSSDSESEEVAGAEAGEDTASVKKVEETTATPLVNNTADDDRSFGAWSHSGPASDSDSDPERSAEPAPPTSIHDDLSESDNESPDKSFQCHICRKWYSTRVTLKIHRRSHQNRGAGNSRSRTRSSDRYECDCCNETFNRRDKLWEHKAEAHRGAMTVRCEVCRKCFEDDNELAAHDRTHTADERAGRCSECGATFLRFETLRRHRSCAHPASASAAASAAAAGGGGSLPHACAQCGKRFSHAHSLTRHLHNHAKQLYRCVVCKASFARADQLAQHLNSHLANYKRMKP